MSYFPASPFHFPDRNLIHSYNGVATEGCNWGLIYLMTRHLSPTPPSRPPPPSLPRRSCFDKQTSQVGAVEIETKGAYTKSVPPVSSQRIGQKELDTVLFDLSLLSSVVASGIDVRPMDIWRDYW